jgi:uncharacterized membrane protein YraQ (UPF0718 family)
MREKDDSGPDVRISASAKRAGVMLLHILPVLVGMLMLTGLLLKVLPVQAMSVWFGSSYLLDALLGAAAGSIAVGHPLSSYILGGELLDQGVSLVAVTAFLVSWVTVGSIQLPAEMLILGRRFGLYRNLFCFVASVAVALLSVATLTMLG